MKIVEKLNIVAQEAKSDGNRAHYHVAKEAITEVERLLKQEERLKIYEKVFGII